MHHRTVFNYNPTLCKAHTHTADAQEKKNPKQTPVTLVNGTQMSFPPFAIFTVNPLHPRAVWEGKDARASRPRKGPGTHGNIFLVLVY